MQRFQRRLWFVAATALSGAALLVFACSTPPTTAAPLVAEEVDSSKADAGGGSPDSKPDASPNAKPDATADGGVAADADAALDADADADDGATAADCSNDPKLRVFTNGYACSFVGAVCQNGETCCNTNDKLLNVFQPSYCASGTKGDGVVTCQAGAAAAGSSFNTGTAWECADKNACAAGEICCVIQDQARLALDPKNELNMANTPPSDVRHPPACGVQRVYNENGSRCRTPVAGNCPDPLEIKLCSLSDNNCGAGTVCTPFVDFRNGERGYCK